MGTKKTTLKQTKLNKKTAIISGAIAALLGVLYIVYSLAAVPGTPAFGLYVAPSTASPNVGTQFNVSVYANLGTQTGIQNIAALLRYDPTMMRLDTADQVGIDPAFSVTSRCTNLDGCKPLGEIVFVAAKSGTGTITPADGILVGNLKFTALKAGTATLNFDADPSLSGFSSPTQTYTTRTLLNGSYVLKDVTPPPVPAAPTSPSKTEQTVSLSWNAVVDEANGSGLAGYKVYRGGVEIGSPTSTTFSDNGPLTPNTAYTYTVASRDNAGNISSPSAALSVTTNKDTAAPSIPGKPVGGTVTMNSIAISWTGSTDNIAVTGYRVFRNGTQVGTPTATNYTDTGLAPGTSYTYTVSAYDSSPDSQDSAPSAGTAISTLSDSQAPSVSVLTVTMPTNTSVALSWTTSTDNVAVSGYRVLRNGGIVTTTPANVTSYNGEVGLAPGTYSYVIEAFDAAGNKSTSVAKTAQVYSAADINRDGIVGIADLAPILGAYGSSGTGLNADVNGDGVVNILDISTLLNKWGTAG